MGSPKDEKEPVYDIMKIGGSFQKGKEQGYRAEKRISSKCYSYIYTIIEK